MAQWERKAIGQRTSDALASMRAQGLPTNAGNVSDDLELRDLICGLRQDGLTLDAIAEHLNAREIPTVRGAQRWRKSAIQSVLGYRRPPKRRKLVSLPEPR